MVLFGQVSHACRAAVKDFGWPQEVESEEEEGDRVLDAGDDGVDSIREGPLLLRVKNFVGSVERLAWARGMGCPWDEEVCTAAADAGNLEALRWAWEHRCPWDWQTCAMLGGAS